jgi:hypothetical protein
VLTAAKARPLEGEKRVRHSAQGDMVMKASPGSAFEVVQTDFALHFLVVALDAPAQLDQAYEVPLAGGSSRGVQTSAGRAFHADR